MQNGTVEIGHTASYYYFGKDPTFTFGTAVPFGLNQRSTRPGTCSAAARSCSTSSTRSTTSRRCSAGNTGCQMGGWFRKEIKTVDDLKGLKFRIGGFAGRVLQKLGVGAAADRRRRHLSGAGKGHDRRRANGSAPMTTRSSASTRSRRTTTIPAGGKAARCCSAFVNLEKWNALPKHYQSDASSRPAYANTLDDGEVRSAAIRRRCDAARRRHQAARLPAAGHGSLLQGRARNYYAEIAATNPNFKKVLDCLTAFTSRPDTSGSRSPRTRLRQLHGAPSAGLIAPAEPLRSNATKSPGAKAPGLFRCCDAERYCFGGWPKSSGGSSHLRHLDLDLARIDVDRLVEQGGHHDREGDHIATMMTCSTTQGIAPQ